MWVVLLVFLPGIAFSAICKTTGPDGVASFINVPGVECPSGSTLMDYPLPASQGERVLEVETGISGRQIPFAGYRSIEIASPEDGGTVRSNEGRVPVTVLLDPGLQPNHFITAYLDGKAHQFRYGSSAVVLTGVDRGTHTLRVNVFDSRGKTLIESETVSFTLLRTQPLRVLQVAPNPKNDGTFIISGQFLGGPMAQPDAAGTKVTIRFPDSGKEYTGTVDKFLNWVVEVGKEPATENKFAVAARVLNLDFKKTQDINQSIYKPTYTPPTSIAPSTPGFAPPPGPDYRGDGRGISTTPGQTNPAFTPKYTP